MKKTITVSKILKTFLEDIEAEKKTGEEADGDMIHVKAFNPQGAKVRDLKLTYDKAWDWLQDKAISMDEGGKLTGVGDGLNIVVTKGKLKTEMDTGGDLTANKMETKDDIEEGLGDIARAGLGKLGSVGQAISDASGLSLSQREKDARNKKGRLQAQAHKQAWQAANKKQKIGANVTVGEESEERKKDKN